MSQDEHNKQKDITFIAELLNKESPEKGELPACYRSAESRTPRIKKCDRRRASGSDSTTGSILFIRKRKPLWTSACGNTGKTCKMGRKPI